MKTPQKTEVKRLVDLAFAREHAEAHQLVAHGPGSDGSRGCDVGRPVSPWATAPENICPIAIKTILVPTDFSSLATRAVTYARRFAEHFGARLILLHVTEPVTYAPAYCPFADVQQLRATRRKAAEDGLAQLIADSESPHAKVVPWRAIVTEGDSAAETDRIARECEVDLIVIASHGFIGLTHLLLGSTAEKIVRSAPCPVLVVREKQRDFVSSPKTPMEAQTAA